MNSQEQQHHDELVRALRWFLDVYDMARLGKGGLRPPKDGWTHFQTAAYLANKALESKDAALQLEPKRLTCGCLYKDRELCPHGNSPLA